MRKQAPKQMRGMIPTELLISVCLIGSLLLMVTILIDKSFAIQRSRDLLRANHVQRLLSAVLQYQIDHGGDLPADIGLMGEQAHMIGIPGQVCTNVCENHPVSVECIDLEVLTPEYLPTLPQDLFFTALGPSGYYIYRHQQTNTITIGACNSEVAASIESTR